jgi:hypothetical protein
MSPDTRPAYGAVYCLPAPFAGGYLPRPHTVPVITTEAEAGPTPRRPILSARSAAIIVVLMMAASFWLRLVNITELPFAYLPARQYHSALIARNYQLGAGGAHPTEEQRVAALARDPLIEPPLIELATAGIWRITGHEDLWVAATLMAAVNVVGGALLYSLLRRLAGRVAGLAGAAIFLFNAVDIVTSRAFQPDPLMVAAIIGAALACVADDDAQTTTSLVIAGLACGFAVFTKDVAVFYTLPVFVVLAWRRVGWRCIRERRNWVFAALALTPTLLYTVFGLWIDPFLGRESGGRILPNLLTTRFFWSGWWSLATIMVPVAVLVVALAGLLLSRGRARAVYATLVAGYVAFGLLFTYHYATHSYYQLPLGYVAAVGVGLVFGVFDEWWRSGQELTLPEVGAMTAAVVLMVAGVVSNPVSPVPARGDSVAAARLVATSRRVGDLVHHDTKVIALAPADGEVLRFYGLLAGTEWPNRGDDKYQRLQGNKVLSVPQQIAELSHLVGGAHYFAITDMGELAHEPDLEAYLRTHYALVGSSPSYQVYDLRRGPTGSRVSDGG